MALVFDFLYAAPTTWLDNADNVKLQPGDGADATRPDIWRYEGMRWSSSVGPAGEPGIDLMDDYKAGGSFDTDGIDDWRFGRLLFNDIGTIAAVDGDVWNATEGRMVQRHYISGDVPLDAYGLGGAGYTFFQLFSGDQRADLGTVLQCNLYDPTNTNTNYKVWCQSASGFNESSSMAFSVIANRWVEFDTRWLCSTTTTSADGHASIRMRHSADGTTWTDLGIVAQFTGANFATTAACFRSGAIVYGMTACIGNIGIPGKFYYAKLYDSETPEVDAEDHTSQIIALTGVSADVAARVSQAVALTGANVDPDVRVSQIVALVATLTGIPARVSQIVVLVATTEPEFAPVFLGSFGPLIWIEFDDPTDDTIHVFSTTQLNDPITYYHGPKQGTILALERVVRALSSDDDGNIESQRWGATLADTQRYWRGILGQPDFTRLVLNRNVRLRMISNPGRLAQEIPRTIALGLLESYGAG